MIDDADYFEIPDAPAIPGLRFRWFRNTDEDYQHLSRIANSTHEIDGVEDISDPGETRIDFESSPKFNPHKDVFFSEIKDEPVGFSIIWWSKDPLGRFFCEFNTNLIGKYRGTGIRNAMLRHCETLLRNKAVEHGNGLTHYFRSWAISSEKDWAAILQQEGYGVMRRGLSLVRENLDNIPDLSFPPGIEIRPVTPEHYPKIISAWNDATKDMRGQPLWHDDELDLWAKSPNFNTKLWVVAWKDDDIVGTTLGLIFKRNNELQKRLRGYTEFVSVARQFRRQGIATALVARCLKVLKDAGMTSAGIGVDEGNPNKAYRIYENLGFKVTRVATAYWKRLDGTVPDPL